MTPAQPLAGKTIMVTRPREQAGELGEAISAQGGLPWYFPLLEIAPATDPAPLAAAAGQLADYSFAIFVSPNAVQHALPALLADQAWPASLQPLAVGPSTVKALAAAGISNCLCPQERFDSEALLALPELAPQQVAGKRVAILRGNGGRELLGDTLVARGARVDRIPCYQRSGPGAGKDELAESLRTGSLDALTVSSSEALGYLLELVGADLFARLSALPLFVPHARIAEKARALGFQRVLLTAPADAGMLAGLCAYNWQQP